jgi:phage terminase large subunit-like protein
MPSLRSLYHRVGTRAALVKATELSDYSAYAALGKKDQNLYLLHVLRRRMEYPELKRAVWEQASDLR